MNEIVHHWPDLLRGTAYTVVAALFGVVISLVFGSMLGVVRTLRVPFLNWAIALYVSVIRNTPELVQLFWIYLVLPNLGINLSVNQAVLVYLSVNGTAYMAEIFRGAVLAVPVGQREAAFALGIRGSRLYRRVVLPQATRKVSPALVNQGIMILKNTTLVSVIAGKDIVYYANHLSSLTFRPVPFQLYTGAMFLVVITILASIARRFEPKGLIA